MPEVRFESAYWLRRAPLTLGLYAVIGGLISFTGWVADIPRLTAWDASTISIQPNATVAAMCAGIAVVFLSAGYQRMTAILSVVVTFLGASVLLEYLTGIDLGIDTVLLFDRTWGRAGVISPGRMGPPGAISWTVIGIALLLASLSRNSESRWRGAAPTLALMAAGIGSLSLIGYLYGVSALYTMPTATVIAFQTSTFILAVSIGLVLAVPDQTPARLIIEQSPGGALVRRILPAVIVVPIVLGLLRIGGDRAGLFDLALGTAMRTVIEIILFSGLLWWTANTVSRQTQARRAAEESALEHGLLLRTVTDESRVGLAIVSLRHRYLYANRMYCEIMSCESTDIVGERVADVLTEIYVDQIRPRLEQAFAGEIVQHELSLAHRARFAGVTYQPQFEGKTVKTVTVAIVDLTERRKAEESLRHADRRKNEFLATLAHELRNPLAPVRNAVDLIKRSPLPDPELARAAEVIDRQVTLMGRLLDDLLDVGRITNDKLELRRQRVDLEVVIRNALQICDPLIDEFDHELSTSMSPRPIEVDADPARLEQVFGNLFNNACRYMERNGRISITTERVGPDAIVRVSDTGIGVPADKLSTIFDMFSQVDRSPDRPHAGLGIGLHLVKRLVEMHGGSIEARSGGLGRGSEFIVRLPALPESAPLDAPTIPDVQPLVVPAPARRILIVDDNVDNAELLALLLAMDGNETHTVHNGLDAVESAERLRPDVVLLDIGLPGMSGFEACRRIREQPWGKDTLLIAITGWGQDVDRRMSHEAGFNHHLVKPVDARAISAIVSRSSEVIGSHSQGI
jgi:PAS domain S-box-containing protein